MIINANALNIPLADKSVQMICTSPPYWGLRDYSVSGQLGLERTPEEYIANMVAVFRECWRVLRDDGTCWINIGDSYATHASASEAYPHNFRTAEIASKNGIGTLDKPTAKSVGLKEKDLVGIPWRLAFALQADGWYLRSDIIWSKPNPMPESVTDRPTKSHEYLFLLAKSQRYYYDVEAVREPNLVGDVTGISIRNEPIEGNPYRHGTVKASNGANLGLNPAGRNRRTVWTIPTAPYKGAHFATFPPALVEPCIKAGTSERGACPKCGKGWRRVVEKEHRPNIDGRGQKHNGEYYRSANVGADKRNHKYNGWQPSCTCNAGEPIPCLVFDPFVGSGTTVKVAYDLGRRGVGLDLSLEYLDEQARKRIHNGHTARLF